MMGNSDSFGEKVVKISSLDQFPKGHQKLLSREGEERERERGKEMHPLGGRREPFIGPHYL
jgi:hypothetical protein